jgi:hypothetical protein
MLPSNTHYCTVAFLVIKHPRHKMSVDFHFRFFNGVSSAFFSPAGATGAVSLTFLSSGVGASVFFEGYTIVTSTQSVNENDSLEEIIPW